MPQHPDDRPRVTTYRRLMERVRGLDDSARIGLAAMVLGGSVGLVAVMIAIETAVRWLATLIEYAARLAGLVG